MSALSALLAHSPPAGSQYQPAEKRAKVVPGGGVEPPGTEPSPAAAASGPLKEAISNVIAAAWAGVPPPVTPVKKNRGGLDAVPQTPDSVRTVLKMPGDPILGDAGASSSASSAIPTLPLVNPPPQPSAEVDPALVAQKVAEAEVAMERRVAETLKQWRAESAAQREELTKAERAAFAEAEGQAKADLHALARRLELERAEHQENMRLALGHAREEMARYRADAAQAIADLERRSETLDAQGKAYAETAATAQRLAAEEVAELRKRDERRNAEARDAIARAEAEAQRAALERDAVLREAQLARDSTARAEALASLAASEMQDAASLRARSESAALDAHARAQAHEASISAHSKAEVARAEARALQLEASTARDERTRMESELRRRELEAA